MSAPNALTAIPDGLGTPLLAEYQPIIQNYAEHRWSPSELSGGKFCAIVYTILVGNAAGTYTSAPRTPADFVGACRKLEGVAHDRAAAAPRQRLAL